MKRTTGILALCMMTGTVWAQNPDVIENTRNTLQNLQKKQTIDQNAALAGSGQAQTHAVSNKPSTTPVKPAPGKPAANSAAPGQAKPQAPPAKSNVSVPAIAAPKVAVSAAPKKSVAKGKGKSSAAAVVSKPVEPNVAVAVEDKKNPVESKKSQKTFNFSGRRDPFLSPVVSRTMVGSGCSSGKRCLAIDQIALTGVVKAESGMIAVVVNTMNKAYFLRENDPVFNGYVVKITGDSIVFKETIQDKLGKPFEREVTKKILTPAV